MQNKHITTIVLIVIIVIVGVLFLIDNNQNKEVDTNIETESESNIDKEPVTTTAPEVKEFTISGKNFSFTPSLITVKKGDKVKITFQNSEGFHDFKIDEFGKATKQTQAPTTEVLEFTASQAGSFEYYCSVGSHKAMGMVGLLKVEE